MESLCFVLNFRSHGNPKPWKHRKFELGKQMGSLEPEIYPLVPAKD